MILGTLVILGIPVVLKISVIPGVFGILTAWCFGKEKIFFVRSQEDLPICRSFRFCIMTWTLLKIKSFIMRAAEAVRSGAVIVCRRLTNGFVSAVLIW